MVAPGIGGSTGSRSLGRLFPRRVARCCGECTVGRVRRQLVSILSDGAGDRALGLSYRAGHVEHGEEPRGRDRFSPRQNPWSRPVDTSCTKCIIGDVRELHRQWGANIRSSRGPAGFPTQKALADAVGVTQGTVARWEAGLVPPKDAHKAILAGVLHQEVRQLFPLFAQVPS